MPDAQTPSTPPSSWSSSGLAHPLTIETNPSKPTLVRSDLSASSPDSPSVQTPTIPTSSHRRPAARKSISSIRRKPVPLTPDELGLELAEMQGSPAPPSYPYPLPNASRSHVLLVDPPTYPIDDPFLTPQPSAWASRASLTDLDMTIYGASHRAPGHEVQEDLPTYAIETETEPATLARGLWRVGFAIPLLWVIGMCILWIPLKPLEEESDPEKAQKLSEMIAILRQVSSLRLARAGYTELKYARRCMWGVVGWTVAVMATVVVAVAVQYLT